MKLAIVAALSAMLVGVTPVQKMRDIAAAKGGDVQNTINLEYEAATVARLVEKADVIVQAVVRSVTAHLDRDADVVVTDCEFDAERFFKQRVAIAFAEGPAPATRLVVRHPGGTVVDGPYRLTTLAYQFKSKDEFRPGEDVILFLVQDKEAGVFNLSSGPFGAFRVKNEVVQALTEEAAKERGDRAKSKADFLNELTQALRSRQ